MNVIYEPFLRFKNCNLSHSTFSILKILGEDLLWHVLDDNSVNRCNNDSFFRFFRGGSLRFFGNRSLDNVIKELFKKSYRDRGL